MPSIHNGTEKWHTTRNANKLGKQYNHLKFKKQIIFLSNFNSRWNAKIVLLANALVKIKIRMQLNVKNFLTIVSPKNLN